MLKVVQKDFSVTIDYQNIIKYFVKNITVFLALNSVPRKITGFRNVPLYSLVYRCISFGLNWFPDVQE
jgi:hypothetical protein